MAYVFNSTMLVRPRPPVSNAERQRQFRARHPGYNDKYRHRPLTREQIIARLAADKAQAAPPVGPPAPATLAAPTPPAAWHC